VDLIKETLWAGNRDVNYRGEFALNGRRVIIEIIRAYYDFDSTAKVFAEAGERSRFLASIEPLMWRRCWIGRG
jgi:hypothetical protein